MSQQNGYDPNAGKVKLYNLTTGEVIERWMVDAREIVAAGGWAYTPEGRTEEPNLPRSPHLGNPPADPVNAVPSVFPSSPEGDTR